jgi:hypothetical protein
MIPNADRCRSYPQEQIDGTAEGQGKATAAQIDGEAADTDKASPEGCTCQSPGHEEKVSLVEQ